MAPKVFEGLWRKIAPVFIGLTAVGWLFVIIGFGLSRQEVEDAKDGDKTTTFFNAKDTINDGASPNSFPLWVISLCGIPLLWHTLHSGNPSACSVGLHNSHLLLGFSVYTSTTFTLAVFCQAGFLSVWFLSSLGMVLYWNGLFIRVINDEHDVDIDIPGWFALEFAGAFIALLFWTTLVMMWPLYDTPPFSSSSSE